MTALPITTPIRGPITGQVAALSSVADDVPATVSGLASNTVRPPPVPEPKPMLIPGRTMGERILDKVFVLIPFAALVAAVPIVWGWGLGWTDIALAAAFYLVSCLGVTVGYHRCFTHRAFKARRGPRIALAVAGGLAAQGPVIRWVADHRRHHAFSDREGDPHSPWLYGTRASDAGQGVHLDPRETRLGLNDAPHQAQTRR